MFERSLEARERAALLDRIPETVDSRRPAIETRFDCRERLVEFLVLTLVGRIEEHEAATFAWRQRRLDGVIAIAVLDLNLLVIAEHMVKGLGFARLQLDAECAIVRAQQHLCEARRAGIRLQFVRCAPGIALSNEVEPRPDCLRLRVRLRKLQHALGRFATGDIIERILATSGVRIEEKERLVFGGKPAQQFDQRHVLQDVAEVAGVMAMLILQSDDPNPVRPGSRLYWPLSNRKKTRSDPMRYTRQAVPAALGLLCLAACMSTDRAESPAVSQAQRATSTATAPATEEERQREIERRAELRGQRTVPPDAVAPPASSAEGPAVVGEVPDDMLALMKADLATRLGRPVDAARVIRAEQVVWPDGSIGCAKPGVFYTQATVVGYRVELELDGKAYRYHSALSGAPIYCDRPGPHLQVLGPAE